MAIIEVDGSVDISIDVGERIDGIDDSDLSPPALLQMRRIFDELVRSWREDLIATWPVDTGRSKASWSNRFEGLVWILRNPVEYAEFVHPAGGDDGGYGDLGDSAAFLEARSEELLDAVFADLEAILLGDRRRAAPAEGARQRSLLGFAARTPTARKIGGLVFVAQAAAFREVSSRERTRRQRRRFRSVLGTAA